MTAKHWVNDDGVSYTFYMIIILLIVITPFLYLGLTAIIDKVIVQINPSILKGLMSEQARACLNFQILAVTTIPFAALIGGFVMAINTGVNTYNRVPGAFQWFTSGFFLMVIIILTGFMLTIATTVFIDQGVIIVANKANLAVHNMSGAWLAAEESGPNFLINLAYFILYCFPFLGWGIYLQSCLKRTSGEVPYGRY